MITPARPLRLLLMTATVIFLLEGLIMLVFHLASAWGSTLSPWMEGVLDASVLSVTVSPFLYILWFRPLSAEMDRRQQADAALRRSHDELEVLVQQRSQELSRVNESFRVLVQMAKDAVITSDKAGHVTFWNAEAERLWGYRTEEIFGKPLTLLMPERFRGLHTTGFQRFLTTGQPHVVGKTVELIGLKKDGTEFPIDLSLASWSVEDRPFFTAIIRDITARKQQEQALRAVVEGIASGVGEDFFKLLVRHLATALRVRYALVAVRSDEAVDMVRTLAIWSGGEFEKDIEYELKNTPCERAERGEICFYPQGVQGLFPQDVILRDMQAESYVGVPLFGASGQVIGHLAILDRKAMYDEQGSKAIVQIFAVRAAAELERLRQEDALKQERNELAKMNRVMIDREERILELKRQANDLLKELGRPPQYGA